jgi:NADPH:quinone reductase-like Zn-dependent oxidoreductase
MRAARIHAFGPPDVLQIDEVPDPAPAEGEALVAIHAAGINHVELDVRAGTSRLPIDLPAILGLEMAGEVIEVNGQTPTDIAPGQRVAVTYTVPCRTCMYCRTGRDNICRQRELMGVTRPGSYAEKAAVPIRGLMPLPETMDPIAAAAAQVAFSTAWHVLINRAQLQAGQWVLVHAAGSGIGSAGVQVARHAGARVIGTASTPEKRKQAGGWADHVLDYTQPGWHETVREITGGDGVDVVMSHVGGSEFTGSLEAVRDDGVVVVVGGHAGETVDLDLIPLFRRQVRIIGSSRATSEELRLVMQLVADGSFAPTIHEVLPLEEVARAHRMLEDRRAFGKVVLSPLT